jgi:hypothetical protein
MWVDDIDNTYAIGALARDRFRAPLRLDERKYEYAIYKTLGVVGYLIEFLELPGCVELDLGLLLPFSEYEDRELIEKSLRRNLETFEFCGRKHQVKLETFRCRPEGFGMFVKGINIKQPKANFRIGSLILGHRNASWLQVDHGQINFEASETNNLGFSLLVNEVQKLTSILNELKLTEAIFKAGWDINESELEGLIQAHDQSNAAEERVRLKRAVITSRDQYWLQIKLWAQRKAANVDFVVVSGGVSPYLRARLQELLGKKVVFGDHLSKEVGERYALKKPQAARFMDCYGLFCTFC